MLNEPTGREDGYVWALSGEVSLRRAQGLDGCTVSSLLGADRGAGMEMKIHVVFSDSNEETCSFERTEIFFQPY